MINKENFGERKEEKRKLVLKMGRYVCIVFVFLAHLQLVFSVLPSDQVSAMTRVYEIYQNSSDFPFVWSSVGKDSDPCSWKGVSCSPDNSSITKLSFQFFSISSSEIVPVLCQIDTLESLDVSNNGLSFIPDGFYTGCGKISGLKALNFSSNRLHGSLPTFVGFRMLEHLDFSQNSLTGEIGLQLNGLDSLKSLNLSRNGFKGAVPTNLGRMNALRELQFSFNSFLGEIPAQITRYRNLSLIDLSFNGLSGHIPEELGELTKLEMLVLSDNQLSGGIPISLSNVTTLLRFAANGNKLSGAIPSGISSNLRTLDLSYNSLTGVIPPDLLSGPNLRFLDLSYNGLEGPIPANISKGLIRLRLGSNYLSGMLPAGSLGSLVELSYLELDNNRLTGTIPPELGMCTNLSLLNLAHNQLTGPLPPALFALVNLQVLSLQFNNFVGEIPAQVSQLTRLWKMDISRNSLNGSLPSTISGLKSLANLDLRDNNLNAPLPDSIAGLSSLIELQLGKNQLSGKIPAMPPKLQIALNLSYNLFDRPIPGLLSGLSVLEVLDLSNNRFSGNIPDFLTEMASLTNLVLSNNQLSGVVPNFRKYVVVDIHGNKDLIYRRESPTPSTPKKAKSPAIRVVIAVTTGAGTAGFLIMIVLFISRRYYMINDEQLPSEEEISAPMVIHKNLLTTRSIHRSNIDFRKAMKAVSDPLNIVLKTRFSTYHKAIMSSGTIYFVKKLNWHDRVYQLSRHEKFHEELEVLGKLHNSNVMIPLAYVLTADSAYIFYEFASKGTLSDVLHESVGYTLDWANRYSIAIGVAQGLAFLHGCKSGPILLLDLSSKSILLKSLNEPQVGDIELCKVIDPSMSTGSISTVAGTVGYIPPEYANTMRVTEAGNVYSFGVILLELLTGKQAVSGGTELAKRVVSSSSRQNYLVHILDFNVSKTSVAVRSQMLAVLKVGLACVSVSPESRPTMKSILRMLVNAK